MRATNAVNLNLQGGQSIFNSAVTVSVTGGTINLLSPNPVVLTFNPVASPSFSAGSGGIQGTSVGFAGNDISLLSTGGISIYSFDSGTALSGTISANGAFNGVASFRLGSLIAGTSITIGGGLEANNVSAGTSINVGGTLKSSGTVSAGSDITADSILLQFENSPGGAVASGANLSLNAGRDMTATNGIDLNVLSNGGNIGTGASILFSAGRSVSAGHLILDVDSSGGGRIGNGGNISLATVGTVSLNGVLALQVLNYDGGMIGQGGSVSAHFGGNLTNTAGSGHSFNFFVINGGNSFQGPLGGGTIGTGGNLDLVFDGNATTTPTATTGGLTAQIANDGGNIGTGGNISMTVGGNALSRDLFVYTSNRNGGHIGNGGNILVDVVGSVTTVTDAVFEVLNNNGIIDSNLLVDVHAGSFSVGGVLRADIDNRNGSIGPHGNGGSLSLRADGAITVTQGMYVLGQTTAGGDITAGTIAGTDISTPGAIHAGLGGIKRFVFFGGDNSPSELLHTLTATLITSQGGINFNGVNANGNPATVTSGGRLVLNAVSLSIGSGGNIAGPVTLNGGNGTVTQSAGDGGSLTINTTGALTINDEIDANSGTVLADGYQGAGGSVTLNSSSGTVSVNAPIVVSSTTDGVGPQSASGGNISLRSGATSGTAINVGSTSFLLAALASFAPGPGGVISLLADGAGTNNSSIQINNSDGFIEADRGTIDIRHLGSNGVIDITSAAMFADVVKIGALGNNGTLTLGGGFISADLLLRLYAGGSNGSILFTADTTLSSQATATVLGAHSVTIRNGVTVTIDGNDPAQVFADLANYTGFGGNNTTTGTFAGAGATTSPFSGAPLFDSAAGQLLITYSSAANGNWSDPSVWNPRVVPNNANGNIFSARINGGGLTQDISPGVTIETLFMNGGTLRLTNPLNLNAGLQFTGGSLLNGTLSIAGASRQAAQMIVNGTTINNTGSYSLELASGNLFNGSNSTFNNFGTLTKPGGPSTLNFNVTLNNLGLVGVSSGTLILNGGGSSSGTFSVDPGALLQLSGNYAFTNGATFTGGGETRLTGVTGISGTITNGGNLRLFASSPAIADLVLAGNTTLTGAGTLTLSGFSRVGGSGVLTNNNNVIQGGTDFASFTLGANAIGIVNQAGGLINANVVNTAIYLDPNAANGLRNLGTIEATNRGLLVLTGNGGGSFDNTGGSIIAFDLSGLQLTANASIIGGLVATQGTGAIRVVDSATFTSLTLAGNFVADNGSSTTFAGTINNPGNITLESTGGLTTGIFNGVTLTGAGNFFLQNGARVGGSGIFTNVGNKIQGETSNGGSFGLNQIGIVNQGSGIIDANVNGLSLVVDPNSTNGLTNSGLLRASNGGILVLDGDGGGAFTNPGTIAAINGSTVRFNGTVNSSGSVQVLSSNLTATGNYTQTAGTFLLTDGTVQSNNALVFQGGLLDARGTITAAIQNNATLRPALGGSGLSITGSLSLLSASQLTFHLGGLTQGLQYGFINNNGNVSLGGQLVVSFVNGFVAAQGNSFTVLSSTGPLSGAFANVVSGSRLTTTDNSGSFLVNYSGNNLVLSDFMATVLRTSSTWTGATGNWSNAANWDTNPRYPNNGQPTAGDLYDATLANGGTITLDIPITIQKFTLSSGTVTGPNNLTLNELFTWSGGELSGSGATNANGGISLNGNFKNLRARTLNNAGAASWTAGAFRLGDAAVFNNLAGASFTTNFDDTIGSLGGATSRFNNAGTFTKSGGSGTTLFSGVIFNNTGTTNVQSGTLALNGGDGGSTTGDFNIASGATLSLTSNFNFAASSDLAGAGAILFAGGSQTISGTYSLTDLNLSGSTLALNIPLSVAALNFSNGIIASNQTLNLSGLFTWNSGSLSGAGLTNANGGIAFGAGNVSLVGFTLNNTAGHTAITGAGQIGFQNSAIFNNSGTFLAQNDQGFFSSGTFGNTFNNVGTFTRNTATGAFSVDSGVAFKNTGIVNVQTGTLTLAGGDAGGTTGDFNISAGATLDLRSSFNFAASSDLAGAGSILFGGGTQTIGGTYSLTNLNLNGSSLILNIPLSIAAFNFANGTLTNNQGLNVSGLFTWSGGTLTGGGQTNANGGLLFGANNVSLVGATLNNSSGQTATTGAGRIGLVNGGVINNHGTFLARNNQDIFSGGGSGNTFNNFGTFTRDTAGGTFTVGNGVAFNSSGTVNANSGTLAFNGGYTQTAGATQLAGGNLSSSTALQLQGGLLTGFGAITAGINNNGTIRPGLGGALSVTGNVSLLSSSNLVFHLGGLTQETQYGFLNVSGNVSLGGQLVVSFVNGFVAAQGDSFTVLSSTGSLSGVFANVASGARLTTSDNSGSFLVDYSGNNLVLSDFMAAMMRTSSTWTGTTGNWSNAANWDTNPRHPNNGQPTANDIYDATLANGGTITLDIPITIQKFTLIAGEVTGSNNLTLNEIFTWSGGTISGVGALNANGGISLAGTTKDFVERTINNAGAATWSAGDFRTGRSAVFNNLAGASFETTFDGTFNQFFSGGATTIFNNAGSFTKSGGSGATIFTSVFNNSGTVTANTGTLSLAGGGTDTGSFVAGSGARISFDGGTHDLNGSSVTGAGTIGVGGGAFHFNSGTYNVGTTTITGGTGMSFDAAANTNLLNLSGGTLGGTATLTASGLFSWTGGTLEGMSVLNANGGTSLAGTTKDFVERTINNAGAAMWSAGDFRTGRGAIFNNLAGATFETNFDGTFNNVFSGGATTIFNNAGSFTKSGGSGATTFTTVFNNSGTVTANSGTLSLAGGGTDTGSFVAGNGGGISFDGGTHELNGSSVTGAGTIGVGGGAFHFNSGTYNVGVTTISGGTGMSFDSAASTNLLNLSGGTLGGSATLTASGLFSWTGGTLEGVAVLNANGGMGLAGTTKDFVERTVNSVGAAIWSAGDFRTGRGAVFNNLVGASFETNFDGTFNQFFSGGATTIFNNAGSFTKSGGSGASIFTSVFNNSGTVTVNSGTLRLAGGGTDTGSFVAGSGASISFDGGTHELNGSSVTGAGTIGVGGGAFHFNSGTYNVGVTTVSGGTGMSFDSAASTNLLNLSGGTLGGSATLTASGLFSWTTGTLQGVSVLNANGGMSLAGTTKDFVERTINNTGAAIWSVGDIRTGQGGVFNNLAGGSFETNFDGTFNNVFGGVATIFNNAGSFTKSGGSGATTLSTVFKNSGTVTSQSGSIVFNGGYTQTAGSLALNGGNVGANSALQIQGGLLTGFGTINAGISNSGTLRPGLGGALNVNGNVSLLSASNFVFQLGGLAQGTQYGFLNVNGTVSLGGQLILSFVNGFQSSVSNSNSFTLLSSSAAFVGSFTNIASGGRLATSDGTGSFLITYSGNQLIASDFTAGMRTAATWMAGNGNWSDATKWSSNPRYPNNGQPNPSDLYDATLSNGSTITLDVPVTIQKFSLLSGAVTGAHTLTLNELFTWDSGTLAGGIEINANGGIAFGDNVAVLDGGIVNNATGQFAATGNSRLALQNGATFNNNGFFLAYSANQDIFHSTGAASEFNNAGTFLRNSVGSDFTIGAGVTFNNIGTTEVQNGGLVLAGGGSSSGVFSIATGLTLSLAADYILTNGASISGGGLLRQTAGILTATGTISNTGNLAFNSTDLVLNGGDLTLTGNGTLTFTNSARIRGVGTLTNSNLIQGFNDAVGSIGNGQIAIVNQAGGVIEANFLNLGFRVEPNSSGLTNNGTLRASNGGALILDGFSGAAVNNSNGTITALDNSEVRLTNEVTINGGAFTTVGSGVIDIENEAFLAGSINNAGQFLVNNADLMLNGTPLTLSGAGTLTLTNSGRVRGSGTLTNASTIQGFSDAVGSLGNGEIAIVNQAGGLIDANRTNLGFDVRPNGSGITNNGTLRASNGGILILNGAEGGGVANSNGTISALNNSEVRLNNGITINGGTLATTGTGVVDIGNSAIFTGTINNAGNLVANSADFRLDGSSLTWTGAGSLTLRNSGRIRGSGTFINASTIQGFNDAVGSFGTGEIAIVNQAAGLIDANFNNLTLNVRPNGNGLTNAGTMRASNGGTLQLDGSGGGSFNNTGTISTSNGTLQFAGAVTSSGLVDVSDQLLQITGSYTQTAGTARLAGGTIQSSTALALQGGMLDARGTITASINNNGILRPALGGSGLAVTGNISLLSSSQLSFQLGGLTQGTQYGFINVNGNVSLGGQLVLSFVNGFQSSIAGSDSFTLMSSSNAFVGAFANIASGNRLQTSDGFGSFLVTYSGSNLVLSNFMGPGPVMVTSSWINAASANWTTAANWSSNPNYPNNGTPAGTVYNAVIGASGTPYTVTLATPVTVEGFTVNSDDATLLLNAGANLHTNNASFLSGGVVRLAGGTLSGGTLNISVSGQLSISFNGNNILDGVAVAGPLQLSEPAAFLRLQNGSSFFQADVTGASARLVFEGSTGANPAVAYNLSGATINLDGNSVGFGLSGNINLTLASNVTARGAGSIASNQFFNGAGNLINQGLISADLNGQALSISTDTFSNQGTTRVLNNATLNILATNWENNSGTLGVNNGVLNLGGTFTNPGAISRTAGSTIYVIGTWNNTGRTYALNTTTGDFILNGGRLQGGTINQSGGALRFTLSGNNLLDGVAITGALQLSDSAAFVRLINNTSFTQADITGTSSRLVFEGTTNNPPVGYTLSGSTINLDGISAGFGLSGNINLTLANSTTARGMGFINSDEFFNGNGTLINQGMISADLSGQTLLIGADAFSNQGTARAINGGILTIAATNWENTGTLSLNNSTINLGGTFTNPGAISRTGGTINITGIWENAGHTYNLTATTGDFRLNGGTIRGGELELNGGALRFSSSGSNILDAAAIIGALQLSENSAFVRLQNGAGFTQADLTGSASALAIEGTTGANPSFSTTLFGAAVNLNASNATLGLAGNINLTLDANSTVRGQGFVRSDLFSSGAGNLINKGSITADVGSQSLTIDTDAFSNQGTLSAINNGLLAIRSATWSNAGGTINANSNGYIDLGGTIASNALGTINANGISLLLSGTIDNTGRTLTLPASIQAINLTGGRFLGGTVNFSNNQIVLTGTDFSSFDGAIMNGNLNLTSFGHVSLRNGAQINGNVTLANETTFVALQQSGLLNGNLQLTLGGSTTALSVEGDNTPTLGANIVIHGAGTIGNQNLQGGTNGLTNTGSITADVNGAELSIVPTTFTNQGTLRAINGSTLRLTTDFTQTGGSLQVNASTISSQDALKINGGVLTGFGNINAAISNNATLQPGLGGTGLRVTGNVSLLSASNLVFQLGGLTQGSQYGRISVTGNVSLGGQLVVSFVNGFENSVANSNSFTVLSSTAQLTGAFANVASGARLNTTGTAGSFVVSYNGNNIVLTDYLPGMIRPAPAPPLAAGEAEPVVNETEARDGEGSLASGARHPGLAHLSRNRMIDRSENISELNPLSVRTMGARGNGRASHLAGTNAARAKDRTHAVALNLESSTQLLDLLETAEPASNKGKVAVNARRAARFAANKARTQPSRASSNEPRNQPGHAKMNPANEGKVDAGLPSRPEVLRSMPTGRAVN